MSDKKFINKILDMNCIELMNFIFENSIYITDPYYSKFNDAIETRIDELTNGK